MLVCTVWVFIVHAFFIRLTVKCPMCILPDLSLVYRIALLHLNSTNKDDFSSIVQHYHENMHAIYLNVLQA